MGVTKASAVCHLNVSEENQTSQTTAECATEPCSGVPEAQPRILREALLFEGLEYRKDVRAEADTEFEIQKEDYLGGTASISASGPE